MRAFLVYIGFWVGGVYGGTLAAFYLLCVISDCFRG